MMQKLFLPSNQSILWSYLLWFCFSNVHIGLKNAIWGLVFRRSLLKFDSVEHESLLTILNDAFISRDLRDVKLEMVLKGASHPEIHAIEVIL